MKKTWSIALIILIFLSGVTTFSYGTPECTSNLSKNILHRETQAQQNSEAETLHMSLSLGQYSLIETEAGHKIHIDGFGWGSQPGEPALPTKIYSIALPPDAEIVDISYDINQKINVPGRYDIIPVAPAKIFYNNKIVKSELQQTGFEQNFHTIYTSDIPYPEDIVKFIRSSGYREYNLVDVRVTPFSYIPISGYLEYYPEINVTITYRMNKENEQNIKRYQEKFEKIAQDIIQNYDQAQQWYSSNPRYSQGLYDFVVITLESLTAAVTPLVDWERDKGRTVNVTTIEWIDATYHGYDLAEKIRKFLREKYPSEEWGIQDVVIVGHWDDIPMRVTTKSIGVNSPPPETDFYYAELSKPDNESWDADGDHYYGERTDSLDFYAEINVGRIPWSDVETITHICEKSVNFEKNNDPSFKNNILLLGVFVDDNTDGATLMEYIADPTLHPWMDYWMKTRIYEKDSEYEKDYPMSHLNVVNTWSSGKFSMVCWCSHGNPDGTGFIYSRDCAKLNDQYPSIVAAAQCSASDTDYLNIGQAMMKQGAVGFLGANKPAYYRSGWSTPDDGSDQSFKYFFASAVSSGEYTQGQALQYALRKMYTRNLWRDDIYETFTHGSLWGNPDLRIAPIDTNNVPEKPTTPNGPRTGKIREETTYTTYTTDPEGDQLYYCWSWGDGDIEWVGPYESEEEISTSHMWIQQGEYEIKVKSKDIHGGESDWSDPLSISMPKGKSLHHSTMLRLFNLLKDHFPCSTSMDYIFGTIVKDDAFF